MQAVDHLNSGWEVFLPCPCLAHVPPPPTRLMIATDGREGPRVPDLAHQQVHQRQEGVGAAVQQVTNVEVDSGVVYCYTLVHLQAAACVSSARVAAVEVAHHAAQVW